jgi:hypothetical protein
MNIANTIDYISTDRQRQAIPWVRIRDRNGNIVEYHDRNRRLTQQQIDSAEKRRMDCVDCHNRPAHVYLPPDAALNQSFAAGKLDTALPFLKREAAAALNRSYTSEDQALQSIASALDGFYKTNYSQIYSQKNDAVKGAVNETQRIFKTYFFPEMKTDWATHPNNIGHFYSTGCFRCHDGEHVSDTGKVIRNDCNICHTTIYDSVNPAASVKMAGFQHPVDLGGLSERKCETCHKANEPFTHPVNLGDISMFQCVECHPKNQ